MFLINHIRDLNGMKRSEKLLLLIMATYAKEDGTNIWPGQQLLMRKCNLCERQIRRLIFSLIEKGYLQEDGRRGIREGVSYKRYKIPVEKLWPGYTERLNEAKKKRSKHTTPPVLEDVHLLPARTNGFHPPAEDSDEPPANTPELSGPPALSTIMRNRSSRILPRWEDRQEGESAVDYARRMQRGK